MRKNLLLPLVVLFLLSLAGAAFAAPTPAAHVPTTDVAFFQSLHSLNAPAPPAVQSQGLDALLGQRRPTPSSCRTCFEEIDCEAECSPCGGYRVCFNGCAFCQCDLCW